MNEVKIFLIEGTAPEHIKLNRGHERPVTLVRKVHRPCSPTVIPGQLLYTHTKGTVFCLLSTPVFSLTLNLPGLPFVVGVITDEVVLEDLVGILAFVASLSNKAESVVFCLVA